MADLWRRFGEVAFVGALLILLLAVALPDDRRWGLTLGPPDSSGSLPITAVTAGSIAGNARVTPGARLTAVDQLPVGATTTAIPSAAREITISENGIGRSIEAPRRDPVRLGALSAGALAFAGLGLLVQRWAADGRLGLTFALFAGTIGAALAALEPTLLGVSWASGVSTVASIVAAPALFGFFLLYPRPLRGAGVVLRCIPVGVVILGGAVTAYAIVDVPIPGLLDALLFGWLGVCTLGALALAGYRTARSRDRAQHLPLLVGLLLSVGPNLLLTTGPRLLAGRVLVGAEVTALAALALPVAFAYVIVRHRLFLPVAVFRRALRGALGGGMVLALASLAWALLSPWLSDDGVQVLAVAAVAWVLSAPLARLAGDLVDRVLYGVSETSFADAITNGQATLEQIAGLAVRHVRALLPVRWTAVWLPFDGPDGRVWRPVAVDGVIFPVTHPIPDGAFPAEVDVFLPIQRGGRVVAALSCSTVDDGRSLGSVAQATLAGVARPLGPALEAALLRTQVIQEEQFRAGSFRFQQALAGAHTQDQVLQRTVRATASLLPAARTVVWVREALGAFELHEQHAAVEPLPSALVASPSGVLGAELLGWVLEARVVRGGALAPGGVPAASSWLAFAAGEAGGLQAVVLALRESGLPFTYLDEQHALELAAGVGAALQRAFAVAQAGEVDTLRALDQQRRDIIDAVAHDMHNPVTLVKGYGELLESHPAIVSDPTLLSMVEQIRGAAERLGRLADDVLESGRLEQGRLALRLERFDLVDLLNTLKDGVAILPGAERITLEASAPVEILADRARVERMVWNLVTNALRYAPKGPIVLRARSAWDGEAVVEVRDAGPGIDPADHERIWEKGFRTRGGKQVAGGSGIGLSLVRALAELHGGRADVVSTPGNGATFRLFFPPVRAGHSAPSRSRVPAPLRTAAA